MKLLMKTVGEYLKQNFPELVERSTRLNIKDLESKGFFKFSNLLFESIIFNTTLTKRQIKILLLIIHFSIGCNRAVARLKPSDFTLVGIYSSDISYELNQLVLKELVIWKRETNQMWITRKLVSDSLQKSNKKVSKLLTRNLVKHSTDMEQITNNDIKKTLTNPSQTEGRNTIKNIYKYIS